MTQTSMMAWALIIGPGFCHHASKVIIPFLQGKAGMEYLVRVAARLYAKKGINCNAIIPGLVLAGELCAISACADAFAFKCQSDTHEPFPSPAEADG